MKVLCIRGRPASRMSSAVVSGHVYTVLGEVSCKCFKGFIIAEAVWMRVPRHIFKFCPKCGGVVPPPPSHPVYAAKRFIPWQPDQLNVTEKEVRELYAPKVVQKEKIE